MLVGGPAQDLGLVVPGTVAAVAGSGANFANQVRP
jgi:hypothetical protein